MAAVVVIDDGHGLRLEECCITNLIRVSYRSISCYCHFLNSCMQATRRNASLIKVGVVCMGIIIMCIKEFIRTAGLGYR